MIKAVLLDIEGTTTPIDFVHKTLFPYSKERIGNFVEENFSKLQKEIAQVVEESLEDESYVDRVERSQPSSISAYLQHLIDSDIKSTPLKTIQGMIWKEGYESGELRSLVFDDVPPAFERWTSKDMSIAIFSSGSVLAQQLLFRYTAHGDLTKFISNYFDTNVGPKREAESYEKMAEELNLNTSEIIFISDIVEELDAAKESGMKTSLAIRKGNTTIPAETAHPQTSNFAELTF